MSPLFGADARPWPVPGGGNYGWRGSGGYPDSGAMLVVRRLATEELCSTGLPGAPLGGGGRPWPPCPGSGGHCGCRPQLAGSHLRAGVRRGLLAERRAARADGGGGRLRPAGAQPGSGEARGCWGVPAGGVAEVCQVRGPGPACSRRAGRGRRRRPHDGPGHGGPGIRVPGQRASLLPQRADVEHRAAAGDLRYPGAAAGVPARDGVRGPHRRARDDRAGLGFGRAAHAHPRRAAR